MKFDIDWAALFEYIELFQSNVTDIWPDLPELLRLGICGVRTCTVSEF